MASLRSPDWSSDNGPCYKAHAFERSINGHVKRLQFIRAHTPPQRQKSSATSGSSPRNSCRQLLYARPFILRNPPHRRDRHVERSLQLPSDPHRLREPATSQPHPNTRHERGDLKQLGLERLGQPEHAVKKRLQVRDRRSVLFISELLYRWRRLISPVDRLCRDGQVPPIPPQPALLA